MFLVFQKLLAQYLGELVRDILVDPVAHDEGDVQPVTQIKQILFLEPHVATKPIGTFWS